MNFGQAVRKAITESVNKTGTDTAWRWLMPNWARDSIVQNSKLTER